MVGCQYFLSTCSKSNNSATHLSFLFPIQNKDDAQVIGIETNAKAKLFNNLKLSANLTWPDARRINVKELNKRGMEKISLAFPTLFLYQP